MNREAPKRCDKCGATDTRLIESADEACMTQIRLCYNNCEEARSKAREQDINGAKT